MWRLQKKLQCILYAKTIVEKDFESWDPKIHGPRNYFERFCVNSHTEKCTYVAFVDLVKAFDTVDHTLMLQILEKYGAPLGS